MTFVIDADIQVGEPLRCGPMSLFPLLKATGPEPRAYVGGPESGDAVVVRERPGGVVSELVADNQGDTPVLLIEGEPLLGAKQDRVLNVSVLLAAHQAITVPVSCVEAGRWGSAQPSRRSTSHAPPRLRQAKTQGVIASARMGGSRDSDQLAVWREVAALDESAGAASPTAALRDVQAALELRVRALLPAAGANPEQVGVIVASGGRPTLLELFDDPVTFAAYWDSLVSGYALDAELTGGTDDTSPERAAAFLDAARTTDLETRAGVSLGDDLQATSDELTATGISWGGRLVHLVCFAPA